MAVSPDVLKPFLKAVRAVLGTNQATTRISVPGGLFMQHKGLRDTTDIDVIIKGTNGVINRSHLRNGITAYDKCFTINFEKVCGVTYRDPVTKVITAIDILDESVTGYMPNGAILGDIKDTDIPWPTDEEFVKLKILSAPDREDTNKGNRDMDDIVALVLHDGVSMTYKDTAEKLTMSVFLEKGLLTYLQVDHEWSKEQWKKRLNLE